VLHRVESVLAHESRPPSLSLGSARAVADRREMRARRFSADLDAALASSSTAPILDRLLAGLGPRFLDANGSHGSRTRVLETQCLIAAHREAAAGR
jgi:hypothetical protein